MGVQGWEESEFPIVCEPCLGKNPYMRMLKVGFGSECKICNRPFTVFKWDPGEGKRWKQTHICQTCAKIKNCCQGCALDLEFHVKTKERDQVAQVHNVIPMSDVNSHMFIKKMEQEMGTKAIVNEGKAERVAKQVIKKLAKEQSEPYAIRSKKIICSFYVKGNCKREKDCPFTHEMPPPKPKKKGKGKSNESQDLTKSSVVTYEEQSENPTPSNRPPPPPGMDDDEEYPSQDPKMLGNSTRSYIV